MNNDRFYKLNSFFRKNFKEKIYKVSLDGGFTCPNRDGKISREGCLFCSDSGSGEFAGSRCKSIREQIDEQLDFMKNKIKDEKVIAYFQNFTNTYDSVENLRKKYYEALEHPKVIGIAIATRPDCLSLEIIELLNEINKKTFLWIELGLQTANDEIAKIINRGYKLDCYLEATKNLREKNIKFVTHMIVGLPNETKEDLYKTIEIINSVKSWGIKIHLLYILKNSKLLKYYEKSPFKIYTQNEYTDIVVELLERLDSNIVVHRLTGDAKKEDLFEPKWSSNKRGILNEIEKKLKIKDTFQSKEVGGKNEYNI
ncbi:MAG: TIGR01212 family radical SAM protein [Fusobacterium perfoetens]|uniref:TIGR01212 family radical SAM protein n=1 Tax=Fusobacterium perfoetens TaxID=852 RepID=UPI0023F0CEDD|nr:TIGR01212 family radical SAM protein [Fusobacterium perfoetens]MCI6152288.1 TIGR01212 family radical SAM protein [Fusobacterium perfoetens]MDY3238146.1 TIGR01212 family radical SAM protein [Fusobacterium perfoetens]